LINKMLLADLVSEFTGTLEGHHPSFVQYQVFSGGWIPSPPWGLVIHLEPAKGGV
jgi:hypothetical protein